MKKSLNMLIVMASLGIFNIAITNAEMLKQYTANTYVKNEHPDIFTYVGTVSVRGADEIVFNGNLHFPVYSKITYSVPGNSDVYKMVVSSGQNDKTVRKDTISVYDSLNPFAATTKAYWDISLRQRDVNPSDPKPADN